MRDQRTGLVRPLFSIASCVSLPGRWSSVFVSRINKSRDILREQVTSRKGGGEEGAMSTTCKITARELLHQVFKTWIRILRPPGAEPEAASGKIDPDMQRTVSGNGMQGMARMGLPMATVPVVFSATWKRPRVLGLTRAPRSGSPSHRPTTTIAGLKMTVHVPSVGDPMLPDRKNQVNTSNENAVRPQSKPGLRMMRL
jgi:hypothetical protein